MYQSISVLKHGTRLLIADDHPLFREALRHIVESAFVNALVFEARSFAEVMHVVSEAGPFGLIFIDLMMPGSPNDGLSDLQRLRLRVPQTPILVVSSRDDRATVDAALALGVAAFISKSASKSEIERAIRSVLGGDVYAPVTTALRPDIVTSEALSPRQTAVLDLLARGRSNRQIANDLNVEEFTVKAHITAILRKLHVKSRLEAVVITRAMRQ